MSEIARKHRDRLADLKESVEQSQQYFSDNVNRYHEFMKFVFKTSMTEDEQATLRDVGKPTIEFNILEAYISRLRGEFSKQQPSLTVRAADGVPVSMLTKEFVETIKVIESHLRAIFFDASNDKLEYNVYSDLLAGGFSVLEVYTDYVNEMSFEQNIYVGRVFDPTLTGFDPLARDSHKGDGNYCFQLFPKTRKQFEEEYGKKRAESMTFTRNLSGFGWSYKNEQEEIALVCDYYEKVRKRVKIIKLTNGHTVTEKEYIAFISAWESSEKIEQPPLPVGDPRWTSIEEIVRYRFCENDMLDYTPTNYKQLPLIFVDGNSVNLTENDASYQMTRPYVYHAKGIQRLKNFAGQSLGNEIENTVQHKWVVAVESIPVEYTEAYTNVQKADALIYNHFLDVNSPEVTLPPPREVQRTPIPPEITNTFRMSDEMTQTILGTYDSALGNQSNQMSGVAIANGAMQSNNASMPYIVGYIKGLNRVAQVIVDLIPKFYRTPRSLPILLPTGKRDYTIINKKGSLFMNYDPNSLQVKVETGVNFAMQKEIALKTIQGLMQSSTVFADFINSKGLPMLLDNIEIRGIEELKEQSEEYAKESAQQKQQQQQVNMQQEQMKSQAQQMQMQAAKRELEQPTDNQIKIMELSEKSQKDAVDSSAKQRDSDTKFIEVMSKIRNEQVDNELKAARIDAEENRSQVDAMISVSSHLNNLADKQ
jgi:hypothetical protein